MDFFRKNTGLWVGLIVSGIVGVCMYSGLHISDTNCCREKCSDEVAGDTSTADDEKDDEFTDEDEIPKLTLELRANPKDARLYARRAWGYYDGDQYDAAVKDFDKAISLSPRKKASLFNGRARVNYMLDQNLKALSDINEAIALDPQREVFYDKRGDVYKELGKNKEALADYSKAIELADSPNMTLLTRAELYESMNDSARAKADYDAAIKAGDWIAEQAHSAKAAIFKKEGKFDAAERELTELIALKDNERTREARGDFFKGIGRHDAAVADYKKGLESVNAEISKGGDRYDYSNRADLLEKLGQSEAALRDRRTALSMTVAEAQKRVNDADIWNDVQSAANVVNDKKVAELAANRGLAILNEKLKRNPADHSSLHDRGLVYIGAKKWELALADFQRATELDPTSGDYCLHAADCALHLNQAQRALDYCLKVGPVDCDAAQKLDFTARAQFKLEKFEDVIATTEAAIKDDPRNAAAYAWQAAALRKLGKTTEASKASQRASLLQNNPPFHN